MLNADEGVRCGAPKCLFHPSRRRARPIILSVHRALGAADLTGTWPRDPSFTPSLPLHPKSASRTAFSSSSHEAHAQGSPHIDGCEEPREHSPGEVSSLLCFCLDLLLPFPFSLPFAHKTWLSDRVKSVRLLPTCPAPALSSTSSLRPVLLNPHPPQNHRAVFMLKFGGPHL